MSIITDFKSIKRILDRQEQKAEFEAKQPAALSVFAQKVGEYYNVPCFGLPDLRGRVVVGIDGGSSSSAGRLTGVLTGGTSTRTTLATAELPPYTPSGAYVAPEADPA